MATRNSTGPRGGHRLRFTLALLAGLLFWPGLAPAQEEPAAEPPAPTAQERLEEMIATLEDEAARQRLIEQLRLLLEAQGAAEAEPPPGEADGVGAAIIDQISAGIDRAGKHLAQATEVLLSIPDTASEVWQRAQRAEVRQMWMEIGAKILLVLAAGLLAEYLLRRLLARPRRALGDRESDTLLLRIALLLARTVLDVIPIAGFAAAAYGVLPLTEPRPITRLVALTIVNANVIVRAVMAVARMILVPDAAALRLVPLSDETANYAAIWIRRVTALAVYGYFILQAALLLGLPVGAYTVLLDLVGFLVAMLVVVIVLQNRRAVAGWIRGRGAGPAPTRFLTLRERFADVWHVLAVAFVVAVFAVWALRIEGGFEFLAISTLLTAVVLVLTRLLVAGLERLVEHGFHIPAELKVRLPRLEERTNQYVAGLGALLRGGVYILSALLILDIWVGDVFSWFASDIGRYLTAHLVTILFVFLGALLVWEFTTLMIERYLEGRDSSGQEVHRSARVRTLLPLLRNVVRVVLAVMVVLTVLAELGVDIGPLLAGAGVVGLAVGFGAQSLVKDVISGTFILLEDAIAVGDVVDLGAHAGLVEGMTIRSVRLRDLSGNVHVVPFGEVSALINMTKEYAYALMDIGIAYREDVDEVIEVLKEIGAEMQEDETYGPSILEPLEVLGLDSFGDSAVIIRIRLKTRPLHQWTVRREFYRRMKRVFDERDIEIPFPHRTLYFGAAKKESAPPAFAPTEEAPEVPGSAPPQDANE